MKIQLRFPLTMLFTISNFLRRCAVRNINAGRFSSFLNEIEAVFQHSFIIIIHPFAYVSFWQGNTRLINMVRIR